MLYILLAQFKLRAKKAMITQKCHAEEKSKKAASKSRKAMVLHPCLTRG
jgi:hypothetical protein